MSQPRRPLYDTKRQTKSSSLFSHSTSAGRFDVKNVSISESETNNTGRKIL